MAEGDIGYWGGWFGLVVFGDCLSERCHWSIIAGGRVLKSLVEVDWR